MKIARLARFTAVAAVFASATMAADLPSGETLLQHFIDRSGGASAYARAKNVSMTGTVEIAGRNIAGTVRAIQQGEKSYTVIDLPGIGPVEEGFDGEIAWGMSTLQGPRILEGDERTAIKRASTLDTIASWRKVYKSARTSGAEDVDGRPAWKVEMTPVEGKPETFYFDKDSGLLVRITTILSTPLGDIPSESTLSDYRLVDGIQTPFAISQKALNQNILMRFDKVAYNVPLAKDRFDPPAGVKSLLDKNSRQTK